MVVPLVGLIGFLVIFGWIENIGTLKSIRPGYVAMMPNTAASFVLSSVALWLAAVPHRRPWHAWLADFAPTIVALVGLLTLTEYTFDVNLLIDHLLGAYPDRQAEFPGRMSPLTAMSFVLFGSAAMMPSYSRRWIHVGFAVLTLAGLTISFLTLLGYADDAPTLFNPTPYASSALHTALTFLMLFAALAFVRSDIGLVAFVRWLWRIEFN
jgi:hypothetical protein